MEVLLITPNSNARALAAAAEVQGWLEQRQFGAQLVDADQLLIGSNELNRLTSGQCHFELICALGGDGTVLRAARVAAQSDVPLLGVNFGNLGFLTGAKPDSLLAALAAFFAGQLATDKRALLNVRIDFCDDSSVEYLALNELVLGRSSLGRDILLSIAINENPLPKLRADGVIVATATGSTAYALSAGGPLLMPGNPGFCIVPISTQSFSASSFVVGPDDAVRLTPFARSGQRALACIDGQSPGLTEADKDISSVLCRRSERELRLLRYDAPDFYSRIVHLLSQSTNGHAT